MTLSPGVCHRVVPLGPTAGDSYHVGQLLVPCLSLRGKTLCLLRFLWPFPATGSTAERAATQSDPGGSPPSTDGSNEHLQHGEALGRCGAKGTAPAAPDGSGGEGFQTGPASAEEKSERTPTGNSRDREQPLRSKPFGMHQPELGTSGIFHASGVPHLCHF